MVQSVYTGTYLPASGCIKVLRYGSGAASASLGIAKASYPELAEHVGGKCTGQIAYAVSSTLMLDSARQYDTVQMPAADSRAPCSSRSKYSTYAYLLACTLYIKFVFDLESPTSISRCVGSRRH